MQNFVDSDIIFIDFSACFCNEICRSPKSLCTKRNDENFKNKQTNGRNMQKSNANNNADIKTSIDNLQFAERSQLQQTPSY